MTIVGLQRHNKNCDFYFLSVSIRKFVKNVYKTKNIYFEEHWQTTQVARIF
jgi:hypothetical protein